MYFVSRRMRYILSIMFFVSMGHCIADTQSDVVGLLSSAGLAGKIPGINILEIGSFSFDKSAPATIAGRSYSSTISTSAKLALLGISTEVKLNVNTDLADFALKLYGELPRITIFDTKFYIKACCQKPGGPMLDVEIAKNDIQATVFKLSGAVSFPPQEIDADVMLSYKDRLLTAQIEKHDDFIDAVIIVKVDLPDPRGPRTGISFTLTGNAFANLIKSKLVPLLEQWKAGSDECKPTPIETSSVSGFFGSITKNVKMVAKSPEACAREAANKVAEYGQKLVEIEAANGSWTIDDMKNQRPPKLDLLKIKLNIFGIRSCSVTLRNLQFDFKNPEASAMVIAKALLGEAMSCIKGN